MGSHYLFGLKGQKRERDPDPELLNAVAYRKRRLWKLSSLTDTWLWATVRNRPPKQGGIGKKCSPHFPCWVLRLGKVTASRKLWVIHFSRISLWELNLCRHGLNEE